MINLRFIVDKFCIRWRWFLWFLKSEIKMQTVQFNTFYQTCTSWRNSGDCISWLICPQEWFWFGWRSGENWSFMSVFGECLGLLNRRGQFGNTGNWIVPSCNALHCMRDNVGRTDDLWKILLIFEWVLQNQQSNWSVNSNKRIHFPRPWGCCKFLFCQLYYVLCPVSFLLHIHKHNNVSDHLLSLITGFLDHLSFLLLLILTLN